MFYDHCINHCALLCAFLRSAKPVPLQISAEPTPSTTHNTHIKNLLHVITVEELAHDGARLLRFFRVDPVAAVVDRL